jgi:hypothetical protein
MDGVTLSSMLTRARSLACMETASGANPFVSDTEFNQWLDDGLHALYDMLVAARGEDYYLKVATAITTAAGTATYTLPTDHMRTCEVVLFDGSRYFKLRKAQAGDAASLLNLGVSGGGAHAISIRYRIRIELLELMPTPSVSGWKVYLHYIPTFAPLTSGTPPVTSFDGIDGWEDYACIYAAIRALDKEESDSSALKAQLGLITERISRLASSRDENEPARIKDTRKDNPLMGYFGGHDLGDWYS